MAHPSDLRGHSLVQLSKKLSKFLETKRAHFKSSLFICRKSPRHLTRINFSGKQSLHNYVENILGIDSLPITNGMRSLSLTNACLMQQFETHPTKKFRMTFPQKIELIIYASVVQELPCRHIFFVEKEHGCHG